MNRRIAYLAGIAAVVASLALALSPLAHRADSTVAQTTNVRAAANRPSTTQPAAAAQSTDRFILPEEFAILQTHNPFGRGHGRTRGGGPESMFVFKGAVEAGNTFTALIEDLAAKRVMQAVVGDTVARGKITSINLDAVVYAAPGTTRRIAVGQDLEGRDVPPTPPPATQPSVQNSEPPGRPVSAADQPPTPRPRNSRQGIPPR